MKKLSPFVRLRLASLQRRPGDHPDANLLAAFAERKLSRREHASILTHLGECGECREVLALSSGVSAEDSPRVLARRSSTSWGWGLAATAALACMVMGAVSWPFLSRSSPEGTAPSKPTVGSGPLSPPPAPLVSKAIERDTAKPQLLARRKKQVSPRQNATDVVEGSDTAAQSSTAAAATQFVAGAQSSTTAPIPPSAKQLLLPNSMFSTARQAAPVRAFLRDSRIDEKTVWSLEESAAGGSVQKSDDGGKTWQIIPVDQGTRFYALSGSGRNVWIGGTDGKLFHSVDDGVHWTLISVSAGDRHLSGSIVGIDAHSESIVVRTDSGETWTTGDGGTHWGRG